MKIYEVFIVILLLVIAISVPYYSTIITRKFKDVCLMIFESFKINIIEYVQVHPIVKELYIDFINNAGLYYISECGNMLMVSHEKYCL